MPKLWVVSLLVSAAAILALTATKRVSAASAVPRAEHPRPDFERPQWLNLNGAWEFCFDAEDAGIGQEWFAGQAGPFDLKIVVPFPWESELSGVHRRDYRGVGWYRRTFEVPRGWQGRRVALKFCAVDWAATVWLNGERLGQHAGGYAPFEFDITDRVRWDEPNLLVVRAYDVVDRETPTGKQTGWYTPSSGIWQTVYLEATGRTFVEQVRITPHLDGRADFDVSVGGEVATTEVVVRSMDRRFPDAKAGAEGGRCTVGVRVPDPKLWTPDHPNLYAALVILKQGGEEVDRVKTYFGLRTVEHGPYAESDFGYVLLNGEPIYLRGALDQSFNPWGIYTAPSDQFLKDDMRLTKEAGFNFLRIHIKVDEPRRLYWADKLGVLLQCDLPSVSSHSSTAEANWEQTLRDTIARDYSHPAIFSWCDFNEEWGIGRADGDNRAHRVDWVEAMYRLTRELDATRLCEDNSGWSHLLTDLNSFHWYGRDVDGLRRRVKETMEQIAPGSAHNYIAGRTQQGEPYINSEYGYVSAGAGDGDYSWGLLHATNALRVGEKMVGYIYTELTDIEWEHNGVYNYDRRPKEMGYETWLPGMTTREVFGEDFLVIDADAVQEAAPGATVAVPLLVSWFSDAKLSGRELSWSLSYYDRQGHRHTGEQGKLVIPELRRHRVTPIGELEVTMPEEQGLAWLAVSLRDGGKLLLANFCHFVVGGGDSPRAEALDGRTLALRFRPEDYAAQEWSHRSEQPQVPPPSKHYGYGRGYVEYRLALPEGMPADAVTSMTIMYEGAARADAERLDWPERRKPIDYPQTDSRKWPTNVIVSVNDVEVQRVTLPDDPADCRGLLSHHAGRERGSYGFLERVVVDVSKRPQIGAALRQGTLRLRFEVPGNAKDPGGFALYGEHLGQYPVDPSVILKCDRDLPWDVGWSTDEPLVRDTLASRMQSVIPSAQEGGAQWRYTLEQPGGGWEQATFDDSAWRTGRSGFGQEGTPGSIVRTAWRSGDIWLRWRGDIAGLGPDDVAALKFHHDEDFEVYVNGTRLLREGGYLVEYRELALNEQQKALFREGGNVIAVHCRQTSGGQYVDVGLRVLRAEAEQ